MWESLMRASQSRHDRPTCDRTHHRRPIAVAFVKVDRPHGLLADLRRLADEISVDLWIRTIANDRPLRRELVRGGALVNDESENGIAHFACGADLLEAVRRCAELEEVGGEDRVKRGHRIFAV